MKTILMFIAVSLCALSVHANESVTLKQKMTMLLDLEDGTNLAVSPEAQGAIRSIVNGQSNQSNFTFIRSFSCKNLQTPYSNRECHLLLINRDSNGKLESSIEVIFRAQAFQNNTAQVIEVVAIENAG